MPASMFASEIAFKNTENCCHWRGGGGRVQLNSLAHSTFSRYWQ